MSMPIIERPENPIDRDQSINDLIESVALIETGLSHIINAEGEKIQKVVNADPEPSIEDMLRVNDSVSKMVSTVSKLEMMLQSKLEVTKEFETASTLCNCNLGGIQVQLTTDTPLIIENNDSIIYNEIINNATSNITYNNVSGEFSINAPGNYYLSWWSGVQETSGSATLSVMVNDQPYASAYGGLGTQYTHLSAMALITVTDVVPTIVKLTNTGTTAFRIMAAPTPIASVTILEVA